MTALYTPRIGTVLFRKHLARYMSGVLPSANDRQLIFSIEDPDELIQCAELLSINTVKRILMVSH